MGYYAPFVRFPISETYGANAGYLKGERTVNQVAARIDAAQSKRQDKRDRNLRLKAKGAFPEVPVMQHQIFKVKEEENEQGSEVVSQG